MNTVKLVYTWAKNNLILVFGGIIGVLAFILSLKNKRIGALEASEALHDTQATDDALTSQQEANKQQIEVNNNTLDNLNQSMIQLQQNEVKKEQAEKDKTPEEITSYWNGKLKC